MRGLWKRIGSGILGIGMGTAGAWANSTEPPKWLDLEPFRVEAWEWEGLNLNFAGDVTVLGRKEIEKSHANSLPELLEQTANLRFASFNGKSSQGEVALRGFGEGSGLRVLVVVDGQRLNRPDLAGIEWQMIPLEDVQSVEVFRGGQNVLYGNFAMAGVIQITTRKGGPVRQRMHFEGGSDGFLRGSIDHAGGRGNGFWDIGLQKESDSGYRDNSETWHQGLNASVGFHNRERNGHAASLNLAASEGFVQFPGPLQFDDFQKNPRQSVNFGNEDSSYQTAQLSGEWKSSKAWGVGRVQTALLYRDTESRLDGVFSRNEQVSGTFSPRIRWGSSQAYLIAGTDVLGDKVDFRSFLDKEFQYERARADLQRVTWGAFIFAQYPISETTSVSAGLRSETAVSDYRYNAYVEDQILPEIETNRGNFPNPDYKSPPDIDARLSFDEEVIKSGTAAEVSLLWNPRSTWSLWAGYDKVYRYPVLDETAAYQGFELAQPVNPDLEAETGNQFEAGFKWQRSNLSFSATLFTLHLEGEIVYDESQRLNVNLADSERIGGDLAIRWAGDLFSFSSQASFVRAEFSEGPFENQKIPLVPSIHSVTGIHLQLSGNVKFSLFHHWYASRYQGNDFENALRKIDAFHRLDFRASLQWNNWTLYLKIHNLLNDNHAPLAYQEGWYPAPGRQWRAGFKWIF